MSGGARPQPVPDETSAPLWEAAARHTLSIARCSRCGTFAHPPDVVCPHCAATDPGFVSSALDGSGFPSCPAAAPSATAGRTACHRLECYLQLSGRAGARQREAVATGLACHSSPHFGGAVLYSSEPF